MQIRHLPRHCCPVLDNVGSIRLASLEYYTMSMGLLITHHAVSFVGVGRGERHQSEAENGNQLHVDVR